MKEGLEKRRWLRGRGGEGVRERGREGGGLRGCWGWRRGRGNWGRGRKKKRER